MPTKATKMLRGAYSCKSQSNTLNNSITALMTKLYYRVDDVGNIFASPEDPIEVLFLTFIAFVIYNKH
jgi:hypothetical protein